MKLNANPALRLLAAHEATTVADIAARVMASRPHSQYFLYALDYSMKNLRSICA